MAKRGDPQDPSPVVQLVRVVRHDGTHLIGQVLLVGDDVEDPRRQLHHPEGVLEAAVRRAGVDEIAERELVDVPQPLERRTVENRAFGGGDLDEDVQWIAHLDGPRHAPTLDVGVAASPGPPRSATALPR